MLTHAKAKAIKEAGRYGDGGGLYLMVARGGSKSWILRMMRDGKRRDMGLGGFPRVSVADARKKAAAYRDALDVGRDPVSERKRPKVPTFREAAASYYQLNASGWAAIHASGWKGTLDNHAMPRLGAMRVDRITQADVLGVLLPLWDTMPDTARRLRQRMRAVLGWCQAHGFVAVNVAGEAITSALPTSTRPARHHAAVDYRDAPDALARIEALGASRLALLLIALTATRSAEARGARWSEIDLEGRTWTIPASRMKTRAVHRVPLSRGAVAVLAQARTTLNDGSGLIFPSPTRPGQPVSNQALHKVLCAAGLGMATVHGFRSTFRTWAAERSGASWAACEQALAHNVGSAVARAYTRGDALEERRELMEAWGEYLTG